MIGGHAVHERAHMGIVAGLESVRGSCNKRRSQRLELAIGGGAASPSACQLSGFCITSKRRDTRMPAAS